MGLGVRSPDFRPSSANDLLCDPFCAHADPEGQALSAHFTDGNLGLKEAEYVTSVHAAEGQTWDSKPCLTPKSMPLASNASSLHNAIRDLDHHASLCSKHCTHLSNSVLRTLEHSTIIYPVLSMNNQGLRSITGPRPPSRKDGAGLGVLECGVYALIFFDHFC